eukprot:2982948-Prymnesium_polylepis.1
MFDRLSGSLVQGSLLGAAFKPKYAALGGEAALGGGGDGNATVVFPVLALRRVEVPDGAGRLASA